MATPQQMLTNIANAIRGKTGKTATMTLPQMVTEINGINAMPSVLTWGATAASGIQIWFQTGSGVYTSRTAKQMTPTTNASGYTASANISGHSSLNSEPGAVSIFPVGNGVCEVWAGRGGATAPTTLNKNTGATSANVTLPLNDFEYAEHPKTGNIGVSRQIFNGIVAKNKTLKVTGYFKYQSDTSMTTFTVNLNTTVTINASTYYPITIISGPSTIYQAADTGDVYYYLPVTFYVLSIEVI